MTTTRIANLFQIRSRFMRSVHLERDFEDGAALQGYVVTPHVRSSLERLVQGLDSHSSQRAWRITGDYGTGKSSFALVLAHLLSGRRRKLPISLRQAFDLAQLRRYRPQLFPVLVTGSREPVAIALLRSLNRALQHTCARGRRPHVIERIQSLVVEASRVPIEDAVVIEVLQEANEYLHATSKGTGLLIILDEFGKFLEFAALHPDRQDIFILQRLAEAAARSRNVPLFIVGVLHQGFSAYAEHLSQVGQKEWEKVAGRFEELLFNQPLEQTARLVIDALNVRVGRMPRTLAAQAETEMVCTIDLGWYGPVTTRTFSIKRAARLYPLHPTVLPVLVKLFSRFGQNERSLFSFLFSDEPFALKAFSEQTVSAGQFYRIHHLYDYARSTFGHRLSLQSYRSHWNQVESVVESFVTDDEVELKILKTVALLNLLDIDSLVASATAVEIAVGSTQPAGAHRIRTAIKRLHKGKRVLYHRGAAGGYCLWPHTSVNLEKAYEEASKVLGSPQRISSIIQRHLETRPIVARRHYIETGNLRHFEIRYSLVPELPSLLNLDRGTADGQIIVPLCETEEERKEALKFVEEAGLMNRPEVLVAVPNPLQGLAGLVQEAQRWQWVAENVPELTNDSYAAEEVSRQISASRRILEKRVQSYIGFRDLAGRMELQWFQQNRPLSIRNVRDLLSRLSDICDTVYNRSPRIRNELVNRQTLSSAAAAARMRLIERIFKSSSERLLGMDAVKKPPEMSMYLSVLKEAGLHQETEDGYVLAEPPVEQDKCNVRPALQRIQEILEEKPDSRVKVSEIFAELRQPPYGIRDGIIPLLLSVFSIIHEQDIAFYESGQFLRQVSGQEFLRLVKCPETFDVQRCKIAGVRAVLFDKLLKLLQPTHLHQRKTDILDVVRPMCIFAAQLPSFTHKTSKLSPEALGVRDALLAAREPAPLIFKDIPKACGVDEFKSDETLSNQRVKQFVDVLKRAFDELRGAYPELLERIKATVLCAFDRPGTFDQARIDMANAAERLLFGIGDPRLKAFCLRIADKTLPENGWLESLASFVCSKPPAKWMDSDVVLFEEELNRLVRQFKRVEGFTFGANSDKETSALRLSITQQNGMEVEQVVYLSKDEESQAAKLESDFARLLGETKRVGLVAASRAIWKELVQSEGIPEEESKSTEVLTKEVSNV